MIMKTTTVLAIIITPQTGIWNSSVGVSVPRKASRPLFASPIVGSISLESIPIMPTLADIASRSFAFSIFGVVVLKRVVIGKER